MEITDAAFSNLERGHQEELLVEALTNSLYILIPDTSSDRFSRLS